MDMEPFQQVTCARLPTPEAEFRLCLFRDPTDDKEHLAIVLGQVQDASRVLVRVHSECFTGDVLGSLRCDCGDQLHQAIDRVAAEAAGVIVYLRQEGRGIGLRDKLRAYNLQDQGLDTVDANLALGHQADERDYTAAARILTQLGVRSVRLLTNNPEKLDALHTHGIEVIERLPLHTQSTPENAGYLRTKRLRMNHWLPRDTVAALDERSTAKT
jgi:3,4-dihydroxy 2-butanone 4-phosphate synthase / GTP cyclohydrolase II